MARVFLGVLSLIFLFVGMASVFPMIYYLLSTQRGIRPERWWWSVLLGPFMLFVPGLLDDNGKRARNKLLMSIFVFATCFLAVKLIYDAGPPQ
jgi:UDP-N-acetylmuramyl pentapeptide phosphotransferase/UDP-N-acetylglucosamine-1-phosphate transferase